MANNQTYLERRVNSLPTSDLSPGDRYYLHVGANKYQTYIVSDSLQLTKEAGADFIECDNMAQMRALDSRQIWALQNGYYKGVRLSGYYSKGDTPAPIAYTLSNTSSEDDGGSVIEVGAVKLEYEFIGEVDIRYFGGFDGTDVSDILITLNGLSNIKGVVLPRNSVLDISKRVDLNNLSIFGTVNSTLRVTSTGIVPLWLSGYKGCTISNVTLDSNNSEEMYNATFVMLTGGSESNLLENIKFTNISCYSENPSNPFLPSSPPLYLVAKDVEDDYSTGDIGAVRNNVFRNITFEQVEGYGQAFVIRVVSNWTKQIPTESIENKNEFNIFDNIRITGDYLWNMLELAGSGTVNNVIKNSYFKGRSITAIDIDKGASYNIAENNYVELSLSSFHEHASSTFVFSPINNHGGNGLTNFDNVIRNNKLYNCGELHDTQTPLEACIGFQYVDGGECSGNRVMDAKGAVCGIHLLGSVSNLEIRNNVIKGIPSRAITTNANQGANHNNKVIGNILESDNQPILLAGSTPVNNNNIISNNTIRCTGTSTAGIFATNAWVNLKIIDNYIYNEGDKIVSNAPNTLIKGNSLDGTSPYSIRTTGDGSISENVSLVSTLGLVGSSSESIRQWNNSWNPAPTLGSPYYRNDGVVFGQDASIVPSGFWTNSKSITISTISAGVGFPTSIGLLTTYQNGGGESAGNYARTFDIFKSYNEEGLYYRRYSSSGSPQPFVRLDNLSASTTTKGVVNQATASADSTSPVGETYSQSEVQSILNELRDLKAKMRTAGQLAN